ncbi:hypothetical protein PR048_008492 [Dryococelus australis]|uniref:BED-type domain-containing protein n=1 Tax=Dryococelus australis TaxID=614101 RepID=A0ABQ9HZ06_9NEOP|nr:hypothetical protein PR048_008492 [Dryococelus australis]
MACQRKSDVWDYFTVNPKDTYRAVCNFCEVSIYCGGNSAQSYTTSNMRKYPEALHTKEMKTSAKIQSHSILPDLNLQTDLSSQDWNLLDQVYNSLKIFHVATVNISSKETTIAEVIPMANGLKAALSKTDTSLAMRGARTKMVHSLSPKLET